ncbi:MAG: tetratricopeptide repeat protein [Planctomycetales bacterium]|nr:tetratricopeptide repeat protein [Planctomycetales bacterium]
MSSFLTDFGLAKSVVTGSKLTRTGEALGTPSYMSPEQARGEVRELASSTDVWSLGCVLYEMLAGRPPWEGDGAAAILAGILTREPIPLRRLRPDIPPGLSTVLRVSFAKGAGRRYAAADGLRDDLDRLLGAERPRARPPRDLRPWVGALAAAGLLAAASVVGAVSVPAGGAAPATVRADGPAGAAGLAARARDIRATDPARGARLLADALQAEPERDDWRLDRGLLLWASGDGAGAREEWRRIGTASEEAPAAHLYAGLEAFFRQMGRQLQGREAWSDLEAAAAGSGRAARLARAAMAAGDRHWPEARRLLASEPGWEAALLRACVEGTDPSGDRATAVREYTSALEGGPPFAWACVNRGLARCSLGETRAARDDFADAIRLDPRIPVAWYERGSARARLGDAAGARADLDEALRLDPRFAEAWTYRGVVRRRLGDPDGALEDHATALRLRPDFPEALFNRASLRRSLRDFSGALSDCDAALRLRPGYVLALEDRALARYDSGDPQAALPDLDEAIRLDPASSVPLVHRGDVRAALRDMTGALEDYSRALALQPDLAVAWNNRGNARRSLRDLAGAVSDYEEALRLQPEFLEARANLGMAHRSRRDFRAAVAAYEEFLRRAPPSDPRRAEIEGFLAECRARLGESGG